MAGVMTHRHLIDDSMMDLVIGWLIVLFDGSVEMDMALACGPLWYLVIG